MLKTESLTKYFGEHLAVKDVSINLKHSGVVGLLGPNGSGKSTVLRMICGSLVPTRGKVFICGFDMAEQPIEAKKRLGYLQETCILYKEFRVRDYLRMVATLKRVSKRSIPGELDYVISACGINTVLKKTIGSISKGYRQRVGIAQAIMGRPKVLLMDEPTASLDPVQAVEINGLIREIAKDNLVFLSTHILSEADGVCDKIFVLSEGEISNELNREVDKWRSGDQLGTLDNIIIAMFK